MVRINSDPHVMEFFPALLSEQETKDFVVRMQSHFHEKGFCYFAVDKLGTSEFIGFIGLMEKTLAAQFTSGIDIGWRLAANEWNQGFASEGAKRCLDFAFDELRLSKVNAIAPALNLKSERIMKKLGMQKVRDFDHPQLIHDLRLKSCVLYEILNKKNISDKI